MNEEAEDFGKQDTHPTSSNDPLPGTIPDMIGPYKVEALLERGGMSLLYLAIHPETKEPITIKVLFPEYVSNPEMVRRFLHEAEIIALTDHPNIIKLYGQGEWEGGLYIAMEFIQGISLRQYLLRNLISLKHALELVMEISLALCHLHAHGVIHRDLKPENILVSESGGIKVIDFGIAQLLDNSDPERGSEHRRLIGTPIYMSPEQKNNPASASYPSDIYSLGIIAYELVLGKLSHGQIHLSIMPSKLQKILAKALQQDSKDRYQDIVDFMADLSDYLNSPALLKENREYDPLSDLSESLRTTQHLLIPQSPPHWPKIDIGMGSHAVFGSSHLYYDFFKLPGHAYGIIVGEPTVKGSSGIIYTSALRGMVRALSSLTQKPEELVTVLNSLLLNDSMQLNVGLSYLVLLPHENQLKFISCQAGSLWIAPKGLTEATPIPSDNPLLGIRGDAPYNETDYAWHPGDHLFYSSSKAEHPISKEQFLPELLNFPPQKQVDSLLRKIKFSLGRTSQEHSLFMLSILRK